MLLLKMRYCECYIRYDYAFKVDLEDNLKEAVEVDLRIVYQEIKHHRSNLNVEMISSRKIRDRSYIGVDHLILYKVV